MYPILPQSHEEGLLKGFIQDLLWIMRGWCGFLYLEALSVTDVEASNLNLLGSLWPKGVAEIF